MSSRASQPASPGGPVTGLDEVGVTAGQMGRAFAVMFLGAALFGAVWMALPDGAVPPSQDLAAVLVVGALLGVGLLATGSRFSSRYYSLVLAVATFSVSVALYLTHDPQAGTVMLYLWATPYAFWFFSLRRALAHTVFVAAACAVTLAAMAGTTSLERLATTQYLGTWLHMVVTMAVVGTLVRWLATRLGCYGDRLARRAAAEAALVDLGGRALAGSPIAELVEAAVTMVGDAEEGTHAVVHVLGDHGTWLAPVASARWTLDPAAASDHARVTADLGTAVVSAHLPDEDRFRTDGLCDAGLHSSVAVSIQLASGVYGVLAAYSPTPAHFSSEDVSWLQATANVLASAIDRDVVEQQIRHAALHDPLTGLANRALFLDRVQHALQAACRSGAAVGVLMLDLDGFKLVNDSLGHAAGDQLLTALASRLTAAVRSHDTVARLGGDEFVLLFSDLGCEEGALDIAERILAVRDEPVLLGDREVFLSGSIGIAVAQAGAGTPGDLLRDADAAMYAAKSRGRGCVEVYGEDVRTRALERLKEEGQLREAVDRDELRLDYQPVVDLASGCVVGAEALLRWEHPHRGMLSPAEFVPLAEETGAITPIGRWTLRQAAGRLAQWRSLVPAEPFRVTVNVSQRQLAEPGFVEDVAAVLDEFGVPAGHLGLEFPERVLLGAGVPETLEKLDRLGVTLVLDDFGPGHSSLGYLKGLPVDVLKLDRSFVADLDRDPQDLALARAVVDMAKALGIRVVAEGVERGTQVAHLQALGCELGQGFYWSAAAGPEAVTALLLDGRNPRAAKLPVTVV